MSKQTNSFQQLVHRIHATCAGPDATVTESFLEPDPDGVEREVDILVEEEVRSTRLRTAIECRNHGRKASIEWIDQVIGKYGELEIDRIVLVNRQGYSEPARKKAARHAIQLWTLTQLSEKAWPEGLPFIWLTPYREHVSINICTEFSSGIPLRPGSKVTILWDGLQQLEKSVREEYQKRRESEAQRIREKRPTLKHLCNGTVTMGFNMEPKDRLRVGLSYEVPIEPEKIEWTIVPRVKVRCRITAEVWIPEHKRHFFAEVGLVGTEPAMVVVELVFDGKPLGTLVTEVKTSPEAG